MTSTRVPRRCPAGCAGHPNWEADYADAHDDGQEVRLLLDLRIR